MADIVIQARNLTRRFAKLTAVDNLSIEVKRGEVFGLLGPDGAGKTTTLRMMCGLLDPDAGDVHVAGFDVARQLNQVRDHIGYMAQRFGLYGDLSVEENMMFYADLFGIDPGERDALMTKLLAMTRMDAFRTRPAAKLSGGMKQKLALGCTLLHRPQILFLDEPTNGVDPVSRRDFWAILYQLVADGLTVFVTTAYLDEAERCNRIGMMYRGRLIHCASPSEMKASIAETCFQVRCENPRAVRGALEKVPGVRGVEPAGAALHLFADAAETSVEALRAAVAGPCEIAAITPSLEDVFIALIRKQEQSWAA